MSILRKILFPFSLIYGLVMLLRNFFFDAQIFKSASFELPIICVGNLSAGGTGKTPMIEYLVSYLLPNYKIATLSRGYGRKTKGFKLLTGNETAAEVGDEPLQFKTKFPNAVVAVDEERRNGIERLIEETSSEIVLLDDAFQHRKVKAGLNILLTTYKNLYSSDWMLPTGNLREPIVGANRAAVIVVTKCPKEVTKEEQHHIKKKLKVKSYQKLFFSFISYSEHIVGNDEKFLIRDLAVKKIALVTGIANPKPLCEYLEKQKIDFTHYNFADHHKFTQNDIQKFLGSEKVLTTEKDYMRLKGLIPNSKLFYLPIKMEFINGAANFNSTIDNFIKNEK